MNDIRIVEQARLESIAFREECLKTTVEEREQLIKQVYALLKIPGSLARLPALSDINEEEFRQYVEAFPMSTAEVVPYPSFTADSIPSDEFGLGPVYAVATAYEHPTVPSVRVEEHEDDEKDDQQMDIDPNQPFDSKFPLKVNWAKYRREDGKSSRPSLFESHYISALPAPSVDSLTEDLARRLGGPIPATNGKPNDKTSQSIEFDRWQATLTHNPTHKLVRKASKCLTSAEWSVAMQEFVFLRAFERIDELRNANLWSFRQPKRQVIPQVKDHWAYLLDEMKWMQADFREEKKWKMALALELAEAAVKWHHATPQERRALTGYYHPPEPEDMAEPIERGVPPEPPEVEAIEPILSSSSPREEADEENEVKAVVETQEDVPMADAELPEVKQPELTRQEPEFTLKVEAPELSDLKYLEGRDEAKPNVEVDESKNPILFTGPSTPKQDISLDLLVDIRDPILELGPTSLWVDPTELQNVSFTVPEGEDSSKMASVKQEFVRNGWDSLFPDMTTYSMTVAPDLGAGRVVSREDEVKTKTISVSRYADSQPLLLGALQPALRLTDGHWDFDDSPVTAEEGHLPRKTEKPRRYSLSTAYKITVSVPRSTPWYPAEDELLRKLVPELQYNWRLIAETFNFMRHSRPMEMRTAAHCYVRWEVRWNDQGGVPESEISMEGIEGDTTKWSMKQFRDSSPRKPKAMEDFVPSANPADEDPKFMRHKFIHRAIKRVMKKREEEVKAREVQHRMMVPHQSHEPIMKLKPLTPQELGRAKREAEEKRLIEIQKRRQLEQTRLRALQGQSVGLHGVLPGGGSGIPAVNGMGNPQLNGASMQMPIRGPGAVPNISQQANANMMAGVQRGPNGELINPMNSAMMLLQQRQAQMAQMANGSPPRPQSATSMMSQGQMGSASPQTQAQLMAARQAAMQDPALRAQLAMQMGQMGQMPGLPADPIALQMYRQQQHLQQAQAQAQAQVQAQAQARAQQMTTGGQPLNPPSSS